MYIYIEREIWPGPEAAPKAKCKAKAKAKAKAKCAPGSSNGSGVAEQTPKTMEELSSDLSVLSAFMDSIFWCVNFFANQKQLQ